MSKNHKYDDQNQEEIYDLADERIDQCKKRIKRLTYNNKKKKKSSGRHNWFDLEDQED